MVTFEQAANFGAALAIGIIAEQKVAHSKHLADSSTPIRHTIGVLAATATTYYTFDAVNRNKDKVKGTLDQIIDKFVHKDQQTLILEEPQYD